MTRIFTIFCLLINIPFLSISQQTSGRIVYSKTVQMQIRLSGDVSGLENMLPKTKTDKFELTFANNKSLWKYVEEESQEEMAGQAVGGFQFKVMSFGLEDVTFTNLDNMMKTDLRELGTKKYIVQDTIKRSAWKLSDETKTILGHVCRKGTSQKIGKRVMMNMDNGKMERKEFDDTTNIIAWFATDIPVSVGPAEYQGQLPGAILEIDAKDGAMSFVAVEITEKADFAVIKEPKSGKKVSNEEFSKEREKLMDEMQKNNSGPGRTIRIQQ